MFDDLVEIPMTAAFEAGCSLKDVFFFEPMDMNEIDYSRC